MKKIILALILVLFASAFVRSQNCTEADKERARSIAQKLEFGSPIRFAIENDRFGDCVHYAWMDEMRKLGIKRVDAVLRFVWEDKIKKIEITKISFSQRYEKTSEVVKDKKLLKKIDKSGLKKQLEAEILERAKKHVVVIIVDLKKPQKEGLLRKEPKGKITGTLFHDLLDEEALPVSVKLGIVEL